MNIRFPTLLKYQKQQNRDTDSDVHLNINFGNKEKFDICLPTNVLCYFVGSKTILYVMHVFIVGKLETNE